MSDMKKEIEELFQAESANLKKPNLMVVGGTGVGKSSLINRVFGVALAKVGSGKPVTQGCIKYEHENVPIAVFDTEGYEISSSGPSNSNFATRVIAEIKRRQALALSEQIHFAWYCLSVGNHRITDYDLQNLKLFARELRLPVAVVLTQCDTEELDDNDKGKTSTAFRKVLAEDGFKGPVFETCATETTLSLDLEQLMEWSAAALTDEDMRRSFVGAQRASLPMKRKEADKLCLAVAGAASASAGLNPLPIGDAALIVPQQVAMAIGLARIYGFDGVNSGVMTFLKGQIISLAAKQLASGLAKLIPGVGQLLNAAVAGGVTWALGQALAEIYGRAYEHLLEHGEVPDWAKLLSSDSLGPLMAAAFKSWKPGK